MNNKKWIPYPRYLFRKALALELVRQYVSKNARFLEIGGGSGDFSVALIKRGLTGVVIDYSQYANEVMRTTIPPEYVDRLTIKQRDLFNLSNQEQYDLIVIFEVLEHIPEDKKTIEKLFHLLKPGGYLLLSVPAKKKLWDHSDEVVGHIRRYEKKELITLLHKAGFQIIRFSSYGFPFLHLIKIIRRQFVRSHSSSSASENTKKSGVNIIHIPVVGILLNSWTLAPFIQISKLFQLFDLAEGYLCLAKKSRDE